MRSELLKHEAPICKVVCFNADKIDTLKERLSGPDELQAAAGRYKAMGRLEPSRLSWGLVGERPWLEISISASF